MSFESEHTALHSAIARSGLTADSDLILASAQRCYRACADGDARDAPVGATRFGGLPPRSPRRHRLAAQPQRALCKFLLPDQFPADLAAPELPRAGIVSLFMTDIESAAKPVGVKALMAPTDARLVRATAPENEDDLADPDTSILKPVFVRFEEGLSLPLHSRTFRRAIDAIIPDSDLSQLTERPGPRELGQLLGFAAPANNTDFYRMLYFHRIGRGGYERLDRWDSLTEYEAHLASGGKPLDETRLQWLFANQAEIEAAASEWRLLLRIDSNDSMNFNMNDADPLYFFLPAADLAAGDFTRLEAGVTQG